MIQLPLLLSLSFAGFGSPDTQEPEPAETKPASELETYLSWLPAGTEALMVSQTPFLLPDGPQEKADKAIVSQSIRLLSVLTTLNEKSAPWAAPGLEVHTSILALRDIHLSKGAEVNSATLLGVARYSQPVHAPAEPFEVELGASTRAKCRSDSIAGEDVWVIERWAPKDLNTPATATFFFLDGDLLLWAMARDDLETMIRRRANPDAEGPARRFADLRDQLPAGAEAWAVRRFDPTDAARDPSSPLPAVDFQTRKLASHVDAAAVGIAYWGDEEKDQLVLRYLTADPAAAERMAEQWTLPHQGLETHQTQVEEGVFELRMTATQDSRFLFYPVMVLIGFAVFP